MDSIGSIIVTASNIQEVLRIVSYVILRFKPTYARLLKGTRRRDEGEARVLETTSTTTTYYIPSEYLSQVYLCKRSPVKLPNGIQPDPSRNQSQAFGAFDYSISKVSLSLESPWKVTRIFVPFRTKPTICSFARPTPLRTRP